jgi:hypothetical protein
VEAVNAYIAKIFAISVASQCLHGQTDYALQPESFNKVVLCFKEGSNEKRKVIVRKGIA